jgi:hypothetical protein
MVTRVVRPSLTNSFVNMDAFLAVHWYSKRRSNAGKLPVTLFYRRPGGTMTGLRVFVRQHSQPPSMTGWRGLFWLFAVALILIALPQARALVAAGLSGGVVIGAFLILMRHQSSPGGPRRGTPITLFPRTVNLSPNSA